MKSKFFICLPLLVLGFSCTQALKQNELLLKDLEWSSSSPAAGIELSIPSDSALLQGLMYKANGTEKHPTLFLLHGYPGNERNLDIAQVVRSKGWNVVYFNYRGSWGSSGQYSIENCVADVVNVVKWTVEQERLQIDPDEIVLFGHSLGAFVSLKAAQQLPQVKKVFALSIFNIAGFFKGDTSLVAIMAKLRKADMDNYLVLNTPAQEIFAPVLEKPRYFDLSKDYEMLKYKKIIMLDEHNNNKNIADALAKDNDNFIKYEVWNTDHSFTNK
ncbi:MAG: pimeloyl-ACP methyl ester carboxylesterase, partial [Marivirga sp.]